MARPAPVVGLGGALHDLAEARPPARTAATAAGALRRRPGGVLGDGPGDVGGGGDRVLRARAGPAPGSRPGQGAGGGDGRALHRGVPRLGPRRYAELAGAERLAELLDGWPRRLTRPAGRSSPGWRACRCPTTRRAGSPSCCTCCASTAAGAPQRGAGGRTHAARGRSSPAGRRRERELLRLDGADPAGRRRLAGPGSRGRGADRRAGRPGLRRVWPTGSPASCWSRWRPPARRSTPRVRAESRDGDGRAVTPWCDDCSTPTPLLTTRPALRGPARRRAARPLRPPGAAPRRGPLHRARGRHRGRVPPAPPGAGRAHRRLDRGDRRRTRRTPSPSSPPSPRPPARWCSTASSSAATSPTPATYIGSGKAQRAARHRRRDRRRHRHLRR